MQQYNKLNLTEWGIFIGELKIIVCEGVQLVRIYVTIQKYDNSYSSTEYDCLENVDSASLLSETSNG